MNLNQPPLSLEQQQLVDAQQLDSVLRLIEASDDFNAVGRHTTGDLGVLLEDIHARTMDIISRSVAAVAIGEVEDRRPDVSETTLRNLGKLNVINALALPAADRLDRGAPDSQRASGTWNNYRRLFAESPTSDRG